SMLSQWSKGLSLLNRIKQIEIKYACMHEPKCLKKENVFGFLLENTNKRMHEMCQCKKEFILGQVLYMASRCDVKYTVHGKLVRREELCTARIRAVYRILHG